MADELDEDREDADELDDDPAPEGPYERVQVRFVVEPNYRGWRVDRYLCDKIGRLSRARAQAIIKSSLRVEGVAAGRVRPALLLVPGMQLTLTRLRAPEPPTPTALPVLLRDGDLLAVDKPAGLPMHPTARYVTGTLVTLARALAHEGEKPDPAHRLDRETSGIVLCGLRPEVTRLLKLAFAAGRVRKAYLAVCEGEPDREEQEIALRLSVGGENVRVRVVVDPVNGKEAVTRVKLVSRHVVDGARYSLLRCEPLTGRQHQIRAHLSAAGLPIVGDKIYGPDENIFIRFTERALTAEDRARLKLPRHALHAAEVRLEHPTKRSKLEVVSPLPDDLKAFLRFA